MGRHYANDNWLTEIPKPSDDIGSDFAVELGRLPSAKQTYNAVFGFMPRTFTARPRNVSIASLIKLYNSRSGRKDEARTKLRDRFYNQDYSVQKKILWLFLAGSKRDRLFCYMKLKYTWDKVFHSKIIELWEKHHEPKCAEVLILHCDIDYVRRHQDELAQSAGYYQVCLRLGLEDRDFVIEKDRVENPAMYVRLLYETKRTLEVVEATDILWRVIDRALLQSICHQCDIAPYFCVYDGRADSEERILETIVPSIAWDRNVMECMRYIYYIAPKTVVAEALRWDMKVRKLFYRLVGGMYYGFSADQSAEKQRDLRMFCKLAYAMYPKEKREYAIENDCHINTTGFSALSWDDCPEGGPAVLEQRLNANRATSHLLENIRKYRLTEDLTPEEWRAVYLEKNLPKNKAITLLSERLGLEPDCPDRGEFIKELLS